LESHISRHATSGRVGLPPFLSNIRLQPDRWRAHRLKPRFHPSTFVWPTTRASVDSRRGPRAVLCVSEGNLGVSHCYAPRSTLDRIVAHRVGASLMGAHADWHCMQCITAWTPTRGAPTRASTRGAPTHHCKTMTTPLWIRRQLLQAPPAPAARLA
jgi:hypothetical protein